MLAKECLSESIDEFTSKSVGKQAKNSPFYVGCHQSVSPRWRVHLTSHHLSKEISPRNTQWLAFYPDAIMLTQISRAWAGELAQSLKMSPHQNIKINHHKQ